MLIREGALIKGNHLLMVILCVRAVTVFHLWHCKQAQCIRLPSKIMWVELREESADKLKICCLVIFKDMRLLASLELSTLTLKGNLCLLVLWEYFGFHKLSTSSEVLSPDDDRGTEPWCFKRGVHKDVHIHATKPFLN